MAALNAYSALDRLAHRLAFATSAAQLAAAEIEDRLFARTLAGIEAAPPVFVTSLPRAGTTTLLAAIAAQPEFAAHLYRDMPFVMAPLLWSRLRGRFASRAAPQERAHGDGIEIGPDSPEAFEEVIWRAFWPRHYEADRIRPWTAQDAQAEATAFLDRHFRKIVALRGGGARRYVSKNNANIARLDLIPRMFPGATVLVPLRHPLAQAESLRRQHLNFTRRHAEDPFARRYMRDIGHYEFGALHRPLAFEGFEALREGLTPQDLDYWLACWIAAFEHVAARADSVRLVDYESLHDPAGASAAALCAALSLPASRAADLAAHFRAPPPVSETLRDHPGPLRERAEALHRRLLGLAARSSGPSARPVST